MVSDLVRAALWPPGSASGKRIWRRGARDRIVGSSLSSRPARPDDPARYSAPSLGPCHDLGWEHVGVLLPQVAHALVVLLHCAVELLLQELVARLGLLDDL